VLTYLIIAGLRNILSLHFTVLFISRNTESFFVLVRFLLGSHLVQNYNNHHVYTAHTTLTHDFSQHEDSVRQ